MDFIKIGSLYCLFIFPSLIQIELFHNQVIGERYSTRSTFIHHDYDNVHIWCFRLFPSDLHEIGFFFPLILFRLSFSPSCVLSPSCNVHLKSVVNCLLLLKYGDRWKHVALHFIAINSIRTQISERSRVTFLIS